MGGVCQCLLQGSQYPYARLASKFPSNSAPFIRQIDFDGVSRRFSVLILNLI